VLLYLNSGLDGWKGRNQRFYSVAINQGEERGSQEVLGSSLGELIVWSLQRKFPRQLGPWIFAVFGKEGKGSKLLEVDFLKWV